MELMQDSTSTRRKKVQTRCSKISKEEFLIL